MDSRFRGNDSIAGGNDKNDRFSDEFLYFEAKRCLRLGA
jgi:hypothetical protein